MISLHEHFNRNLGTYRALFVDDCHVSEVQNLTKQLHQPTKHEGNPLLVGEGDEGDYVVLHGSILHDPEDDLYKIWYMGGQGYHYALSKDGLTWEKPDLGAFGDRRQPDSAVFRGACQSSRRGHHSTERPPSRLSIPFSQRLALQFLDRLVGAHRPICSPSTSNGK